MAIINLLDNWRKIIAEYKKNILLITFTAGFITYLFVGAVLFVIIEAPHEHVALKNIIDVKSKVLSKYPAIPGEAIDEVLHGLTEAGVKGIILSNSTAKWTLGNAVLFSATLLTTIGYGHLSPTTVAGKLITMTYTGIGIPITLLLLATYVDRLMFVAELYKAVLFRRLGKHLRPQVIRTAHMSTIMTLIITGCFIVPAWVFTAFEVSWNYLDALYFCFISLTTVGLGDYVPGLEAGHPHVDLYRFGATLYVICGVTVMMFLMTLTADFIHNFNNPYQTIYPVIAPQENSPIVNNDSMSTYGTLPVHQSIFSTKDISKNMEP